MKLNWLRQSHGLFERLYMYCKSSNGLHKEALKMYIQTSKPYQLIQLLAYLNQGRCFKATGLNCVENWMSKQAPSSLCLLIPTFKCPENAFHSASSYYDWFTRTDYYLPKFLSIERFLIFFFFCAFLQWARMTWK